MNVCDRKMYMFSRDHKSAIVEIKNVEVTCTFVNC